MIARHNSQLEQTIKNASRLVWIPSVYCLVVSHQPTEIDTSFCAQLVGATVCFSLKYHSIHRLELLC